MEKKHMNFVQKLKITGAAALACGMLAGCGNAAQVSNAYEVYSSDFTTGNVESSFFASNLCVTDNVNFGTGEVTSKLAEAAGVFNMDQKEVVYNQNIFQKMYPASTTKIMTAYIIIRYGDLDDLVTVSYNAAHQGADSSVCGLKEGDVLTVRDLLYGLLLASGNDAAVALAEYYSGDVDSFVALMNEEAAKMGATGTHFMNSCGLPDENHYTTVYDMYLMYSHACLLQDFLDISGLDRYEAKYTSASGKEVTNKWENTCRYISGYVDQPEGIHVLSAKTGTTNAAGYCLCCYVENEKQERVISIVYKAGARADLYKYMNEILRTFAK